MNSDNINKDAQTPVFGDIQQRLRVAIRERWFRHMIRGRGYAVPAGFFDSYPLFLTTSVTRQERDRLNQRYRALIASNSAIIADQRILDIASHDGRWSFAAHKAGAEYVLGIEARRHLVEAARSNMREYRVPENQVEFIQGDVLAELDRLEAGVVDTVFCFGFLYHTIDHMPLLRKIARLKPKHLVIDTAISTRPGAIIQIRGENIEDESAGAVGEAGTPGRGVIGKPTRSALELMLQAAGFLPLRYYDWLNAGIRRWDDLEAYYLGTRVSLTAIACSGSELSPDSGSSIHALNPNPVRRRWVERGPEIETCGTN